MCRNQTFIHDENQFGMIELFDPSIGIHRDYSLTSLLYFLNLQQFLTIGLHSIQEELPVRNHSKMSMNRPVTAVEMAERPNDSFNARRVAYIFVGKPGVGKSLLSEKLASSLSSVLVTPEKVLQESLGSNDVSSAEVEKVSTNSSTDGVYKA